MNTTFRVVAVVAVLWSAESCRADSGSIWSLGPGGQVQGQIGTWQRQGGRAWFQWAGSNQGFVVDLQQPNVASSQDFYVYSYIARGQPRRPSNSFATARPLVGPPRQIYGYTNPTETSPIVARGDVALDVRTFTGFSIDGFWRPIETVGNPRLTVPIRLVPGEWQSVRFVIDNSAAPGYAR